MSFLRVLCLILLGPVSLLQAVKPLPQTSFLGPRQSDVSVSLAKLAEQLPPGVSKDLFQSFSLCGQCNSWKRLGEAHDGGYLSCMDTLQPGKMRAAFSLGVETHDKWSLDVYNTFNIPVFQYDCTVQGPAQLCGKCKFFQACVASKDMDPFPGKTKWTLAEAIEQSEMADAPDRSLLMKMDISSSEWPTFAESDLSTLNKFRQLIVEFHHLELEDKHELYLQAMQRLKTAGFKVTHVHGNNWSGWYEKVTEQGSFQIPRVVEVTLDALVPSLPSCEDPTLQPLDSPNRPTMRDLEGMHTEPST